MSSGSESGGSPRKDGDEMSRQPLLPSQPPQPPQPTQPTQPSQPSQPLRPPYAADDDVIELFSDTESDPESPKPPLPANIAYVEVPLRPRYALESRAASLVLEPALPLRKRPRAATVDDPDYTGPSKDGGIKKSRTKPPISTTRTPPSRSPTPEDAGNVSAQGLVQALSLVHQQAPVFSQDMPRAIKKPPYARGPGRRIIESDTEDGPAPSISAHAVSSTTASAPQDSRVAMAPLEATSAQERRSQPPTRPAPPLPRTKSLKRTRTEGFHEIDKDNPLRPVPDDIGTAEPAVRKKRKGPPGIRPDDLVSASASENKANPATGRKSKGVPIIADHERGSRPRNVARTESGAVERPRPVRPRPVDPPRPAAKEVMTRRPSTASRPVAQERPSSNLAAVITSAASGSGDVQVQNTVALVNSATEVVQPPEPPTVVITPPGPSNAPAPVPATLPPAPTTHYHAPYSVSAHTSLIASYPPPAVAAAPGAQADPLLSVSQVLENSRLSAIHHTDALFGAIRDLLQQCKHSKEEQTQLKEMLAKLEESYKQTAQGLKQQAEELRATKEELLHVQEDSRRVKDEWHREREDKHLMAKSFRALEQKVAKLEAAQPPACEHRCQPFGPENHGMLRSVVGEIVQATMNQSSLLHRRSRSRCITMRRISAEIGPTSTTGSTTTNRGAPVVRRRAVKLDNTATTCITSPRTTGSATGTTTVDTAGTAAAVADTTDAPTVAMIARITTGTIAPSAHTAGTVVRVVTGTEKETGGAPTRRIQAV
ncbi:hypothetical protein GY45DRAFT_408547 [Cubamyces sp. BRFM 1775]|nr:hypothetical protein GY45DRAFT_408547 [Cubamyces sp. BRFM 1775]